MPPSDNAQQVYIKNHKRPYCNVVVLTPQNPILRIDPRDIPDGVGIAIKNDPDNQPGTIVRVDGERSSPTSWPLVVGEGIVWDLQDAGSVWVGVLTWPANLTQVIVDYSFEIDYR
jgi:hypothetical protein